MVICQGIVREMSGNFEPTQMWQPCYNIQGNYQYWMINHLVFLWEILPPLFFEKKSLKQRRNKKVLLRERKRHTARCVANTPYVVLTGYPPGGGTRVPPLRGGYPVRYPGGSGYPPGGVPSQVPGGVRVPPRGGTRSGTPGGSGYPSRGGVPSQVPPPGGYPDPPSPPCGQTNTCENSTFPSYYVRGR